MKLIVKSTGCGVQRVQLHTALVVAALLPLLRCTCRDQSLRWSLVQSCPEERDVPALYGSLATPGVMCNEPRTHPGESALSCQAVVRLQSRLELLSRWHRAEGASCWSWQGRHGYRQA